MNKYYILAGLTGSAAGALLARFYFKKKYAVIAEEEINSVKDALSERKKVKAESGQHEITTEERTRYNDCIRDYVEESHQQSSELPYVISPNELDEYDDYETISLTLYADGTLTDDNDEVLSEDEIEEIIGKDSLNHFGEYEEDSVFVRNDARKCDYEILKSLEDYAEVLARKPYLAR